jgi:hypothetical protein
LNGATIPLVAGTRVAKSTSNAGAPAGTAAGTTKRGVVVCPKTDSISTDIARTARTLYLRNESSALCMEMGWFLIRIGVCGCFSNG